MAERLLDKASYGLVRTNPKLTTNIKVVTNGNDIYLESFSANTELSSSRFKAFKVDAGSTYDQDLYRFYQNGSFPTDIAYQVYQQFQDTAVLSSYDSQYEMFYSAGAQSINSESYIEDLGILAPLWLNEQIPNYFVVFRLDNPAAVNNLNALSASSGETDAQTAAKFSEFVLENCTAIKTFDLTSNTGLGRYIRNYRSQKDFPIAPITATWRRDEPFQWNGISLTKGGFSSGGSFSYEDLVSRDATIMQNEYFFTQGFQRNGIVLANLLNMQFLFSDEYAPEYSLNRYFGLYVNDVAEGNFDLSGEAFYKGIESMQTPRITTVTQVSDELNSELFLSNPRGVLIYVDPATVETQTGLPTPARVNEVESIFYVKDKKGVFHTVKRGSRWGVNQIRLFDKKIDISLLTGYKQPDSFASAQVVPGLSRAASSLTILDEVTPGVTITFFDSGIQVGQVAAEVTLTAGPGTNNGAFFNPTGTLPEIAKALATAINQGIPKDNRYFEATYSDDTVYVRSLFGGSRFNRISFAIDWVSYPSAQLSSYPETSLANPSANFVGGGDFMGGQLKVAIGDQARFKPGNFVKTKGGFAKIGPYIPYLELPIRDALGRIIGYREVDEFVIVTVETDQVLLTGSSQAALYSNFKPEFGRFSFFPVRDFDYDFYSDLYSQDGELLYEIAYYNAVSAPGQYIGVAANPDIRDFYDEGGFATLIGLLRESNPDFDFDTIIASEYSRLEENYLKEQAVASRVIPYINKWGYFKDGRDTRNHPYRLDLSEAFTLNNFAPSRYDAKQSPFGFSHEWSYLCEFPPYFGQDAIEDSWSYFDTAPTDSVEPNPFTGSPYIPGTFQSVVNNYFDEYFIADKFTTGNQITLIDRQLRYGRFRGGDRDNFAEAFLRGVRVIAKPKALNSQRQNFNAARLSYVRNSSFNDYKFSCMLVPNAPDKPKSQIKFVKNDKWKTVTMLIFASLDEECINDGRQYIDRTSLYALSNSYVYDPLTCQPVITTDGSYEYKNGIMQGAISLQSSSSSGGSYQIIGQTDINGVSTKFTRDVTIGLDGQYTPIQFQIAGDTYVISQISQVINDFTLIAGDVTRNGSTIALPDPGASTIALKQATYVTIGGGAGTFTRVLDSVSFAEIANQVNVGSPDIIYETIQENGEPVRNQDGTLSQTFSIELRAQDDIIKSVYLGVLPDPNKPTIFNLVNVIGYDLSLQTSPRITPIARHSNYYEPYAKDLFFFRDPYLGIDFNSPTGSTATDSTGGGIPDEDYKLRVLALMRYKNTQFYSAHIGFGQIERMFYHKVNVEDASSVLELSQDSAFLSLYPLINEVGIAYRDFYAFSSNWEPGYFRKSIDKTQVQSVIGTRSMLEKKSFFGSKYLKVPSEIILETFIPSPFSEDAITDPSLVPGNFMYVENQSTVQFYLFIQKRLIQELAPNIKATLQQYVNPLYGFGSEETIDDDVSQYIIQNLLQLYKVDRIELFVKQSRLEQPNDYTTAALSNEEKAIAGLRLTDAFSSRLLNTNQFDTRLIYNRRLGFSESFGFNIVIVKK
jgi:hypothetical protein